MSNNRHLLACSYSYGLCSFPSLPISIRGVRIDEIRLENLRLLVEDFGSTNELAHLCKVSSEYLDQLLSGVKLKSGKPRKMGDPVARKLETGCGKKDGWMDEPHRPHPPATDPDRIVLAPDEQIFLVKFRRASPKLRRLVKLILDLDED